MKVYDVFISHASEDKQDVVRPLAKILESKGISVWLDERELTVGDNLRRSIEEGLRRSRFGVVVLSPDFFSKQWPQKELDALIAREDAHSKVVLPVWHNVTRKDLINYAPTLADKIATLTSDGIDSVATDIERAITRGTNSELALQSKSTNLKKLFKETGFRKNQWGRKKILTLALIAALSVTLLIIESPWRTKREAEKQENSNPEPSKPPTPLRLQLHISNYVGFAPFYIANKLGKLKTWDLIQVQNLSSEQRIAMDMTSRITLLTTSLDTLLRRGEWAAKFGTRPKVLLFLAESNGADILLAQGQISSISELRAKRVGAWKAGASYLFARYEVLRSGIDPKEIEWIEAERAADLVRGLNRKEFDAIAIWSPWDTRITGDRIRLSDTRNSESASIYEIAYSVRDTHISQHDMDLLLYAWDQGVFELTARLEYHRHELASWLEVSNDEVDPLVRSVKFLTAHDNQSLLPWTNVASRVSKQCTDSGLSTGDLTDISFDSSFVRRYIK